MTTTTYDGDHGGEQDGDQGGDQQGGPVRWGFLGVGKIARTVAADLALLTETGEARLVAAGSRREGGAAELAAAHGARAHEGPDGYARLVEDEDVEIVYVASPHSEHLDHVRLALEAGKHVLVEKPVTLGLDDAEEMVALARRHDRFLMEAMWTACHPTILAVRDRLATGELGRPRHLHAELGFVVDADPGDRMLDPALGAGALLDMGIYPLTLAHLLLGEAEELAATADLSERGIDLDVAVTGRYPGGALATMTASITSWSSRRASLATDRGRIDLDDFHHPRSATFTPYDVGGSNDTDAAAAPVTLDPLEPVRGRGYTHELVEAGRCVRAGLRESPLVPHAQTLVLMGQLDRLLGQVGVRYPPRPS